MRVSFSLNITSSQLGPRHLMDESAEASDDNVEQFVNTGVEVDWKKFKEWRSLTDNEAVNWSPGIGGGNGDDCMFNDGRLTFSDWLTAQCGRQELCTEKLVLGEVNTKSFQGSILDLPGDASRFAGGRKVNQAAVAQKALQLFQKQKFKSFDYATVVTITDDGPQRIFYLDGHQRFYVLGLVAYSYYRRDEYLPAWLKGLVSAVSIKYNGCRTLAAAKAHHLSIQASMEFGIAKLSWLDVMLDAKDNGSQFAVDVDKCLRETCLEHHDKLRKLTDGSSIADRISINCLRRVEQLQEIHGCALPPFHHEWLKQVLLEGKTKHKSKSSESCTEEEQELSVSRILGEVVSVAKELGKVLSIDNDMKDVLRHKRLGAEARAKLILTSKKYVRGIRAAASSSGASYDHLLPQFIAGEYDNIVYVTMNPETKGRYWSFVKAADAAHEEAHLESQAGAAKKKIEEAQATAKQLQESITTLDEKDDAIRQGMEKTLRQRLSQAYFALLRAHYATAERAFQPILNPLEEEFAEHLEDLSKRAESLKCQPYFRLCKEKDIVGAAASAREGRPVFVFVDLSVTAFESDSQIEAVLGLCQANGGAIALLITTLQGERSASKLFGVEMPILKILSNPPFAQEFTVMRYFMSVADGCHGSVVFILHNTACPFADRLRTARPSLFIRCDSG